MFETEADVRFYDADAAGMLFFANHFKMAHAAYEGFMKSIGLSLDHLIRSSDYLLPIAHAEADYKKGLGPGDKVSISLQAEIGKTSFSLSCVFRDSDGNVAAHVKTVHVCVDKTTGEKIPLPDELRRGLLKIV